MNGTPWTDSELAIVRRLYGATSTKKLTGKLPGRTVPMIYRQASKMGLRKSAEYLLSADACRLRPGDNVGASCRFQGGHVPANKGLRRPGWSAGRMWETQFRPGSRTGKALENWKPIGTILTDTQGYLRIKVREGKKGEAYGFGNVKIWPLLQRHTWERERGPIPFGHVLCFKDGDRANCAIGNLELVSRADLMRRNTIHNLPAALKEVILLKGAIRAVVTKRRKKAA